jgi:hypothetical protein
MNRNTYLALLAAVSIPFAAVAQEKAAEDPAAQEEPLIKSDDQAADEAMKPTEQTAEEETMPADETEQAAETDATGAEDEATETAQAGEEAVEGPFVTVPLTGAWRVTDLEGKDVEDANGDNIGDITDVLVNEKGEVIAVLVGVGGFLGIGQKDVAVSMSALQFGPGKTEGLKTEEQRQQELQAEADAQAQLPATGTGGTATTNTTASIEPPVQEDPVVGRDNLPDRIVLNVTREELEAAPAYDDVAEGIDSGMTSEIPATESVEPEVEPAD